VAKVSILTPTYDREPTATVLMKWIQNQTHADWEWWLHHDGVTPYSRAFQDAVAADPRINYVYSPERQSIGAKTNAMLERATGEIIMHFDDDDYYGPTYVETMVAALEECDFVKLSGWFLYKPEEDFFAYWHQSFVAPYHYVVAPDKPILVISTQSFAEHAVDDFSWGYGFTYAYRSHVRDVARLKEDFCHNAENNLMQAVRNHGQFKARHFVDKRGIVLHVIHNGNASLCYPQQYLPANLLQQIFGEDMVAHLDAIRKIIQSSQAKAPEGVTR
jgi:glycosyltransferase involved in cell wall biosynthesis